MIHKDIYLRFRVICAIEKTVRLSLIQKDKSLRSIFSRFFALNFKAWIGLYIYILIVNT